MPTSRRAFLGLVRFAIVALAACSSGATAQNQASEKPSIRVLFVGNSYTYFNNLPEIFSKLAEAGRQAKVEIRMEAPGGWRLKDHWEKGEARKALGDSKWDYVVLQEQSTLGINYFVEGLPRVSSDEVFRPYAEKWAAEIRKAGATPVFYLTWARKASPDDQAALNYAYLRAAAESESEVAPVGIAWAALRGAEPAVELYIGDGSHPSPAGSYLAGCTLYATIFHTSPVGLPAKVTGIPVNLDTGRPEPGKTAILVDLAADRAMALQTAAWTAWQDLARVRLAMSRLPVPAPLPAPLLEGLPLSAPGLEGTWTGDLRLYPPPFLPVNMVLQLRRAGAAWRGHLALNFHSKDQPDRSLELPEIVVSGRELTFVDPKGPQNLRIRFRAVMSSEHELAGSADATLEAPDSPVRLLGTWRLRKK